MTKETEMTELTSAASRLIALAADLDLAPVTEAPYRGAVRVALHGGHCDAGTGSIFIGARSGRVLRMVLRHGVEDPRPRRLTRHIGYRAAWTALVEYGLYAYRMGLIPEPQDGDYIPLTTDDDLEGLAALLDAGRPAEQVAAPQPMAVTSGRATWHHGVHDVVTTTHPAAA